MTVVTCYLSDKRTISNRNWVTICTEIRSSFLIPRHESVFWSVGKRTREGCREMSQFSFFRLPVHLSLTEWKSGQQLPSFFFFICARIGVVQITIVKKRTKYSRKQGWNKLNLYLQRRVRLGLLRKLPCLPHDNYQVAVLMVMQISLLKSD